ncbi:hypothetical protein [Streptomyces sp. NPDC058623]|uniref:hypothetical protein n=1 Tax=Streptomyces sp. NPDC058623 TaxID=3346563 RepID=UPI00364F85CE
MAPVRKLVYYVLALIVIVINWVVRLIDRIRAPRPDFSVFATAVPARRTPPDRSATRAR